MSGGHLAHVVRAPLLKGRWLFKKKTQPAFPLSHETIQGFEKSRGLATTTSDKSHGINL